MGEKYLLIFIENSGNDFIEEQKIDEFSKIYLTESTANNRGSDYEVNLPSQKNMIYAQGGRIRIEPIAEIGNRYGYHLPIQKLINQA